MLKKIMVLGIAMVVLFSMAAMSGCNPKEAPGTFYTLQEAYDAELLSKQDLQSIAYYHGSSDVDGAFVPTLKDPNVLDKGTKKAIKQSWVKELRTKSCVDATIKGVAICEYYGTYDGSIALMIADSFSLYDGDGDDVLVAEVLFVYSDLNRILIWKSNSK